MKIFTLLFSVFLTLQISTVEKIKVLILDGLSTHNWKATTQDTQNTLIQSGRFDVDVSTSPDKNGTKEDWNKWQPKFANYQVVVTHINDRGKSRWSEQTKKDLDEYLKSGGGLVVVHSANNSSYDWPEYNKMIAVGGWGGREAGTAGFLLRKVNGQWKADSPDKGESGGHGPQREFLITIDKPEHPIVKGMPSEWMHSQDELYHSLRGPAKDVEVLGGAYCDETKTSEPMLILVKYGKGTVFHTPMGHYNDFSTKCLGFQAVFARATEFVATGNVTIGLPKGFPSKEKAVHIEPTEVEWIKE